MVRNSSPKTKEEMQPEEVPEGTMIERMQKANEAKKVSAPENK